MHLQNWADHMAGRVACARGYLAPMRRSKPLQMKPFFFRAGPVDANPINTTLTRGMRRMGVLCTGAPCPTSYCGGSLCFVIAAIFYAAS